MATPAVTSALSIFDYYTNGDKEHRITIGIKMHDVIDNTDFINALYRPRQSKHLYIFKLTHRIYKIHDSEISSEMDSRSKISIKCRNNMKNKTFNQILYHFIKFLNTTNFREYYVTQELFKIFKEQYGYIRKINNDPAIQIWKVASSDLK